MEKGEIPNDIISQQNERIQEYIKQRKWKLVKKYSDRKKEEFEETAYLQMKQDAMGRQFDCLVIDSMFRCGRNSNVAAELFKSMFLPAGLQIAVVEDDFCSLDVTEQEAVEYLDRKAKEYKDKLVTEDMRKFNETKKYYKYGFRYKDGKMELEIDPEPAEIVRRIFRLSSEGQSCSEIAKILTEEKIESSGNYVNKLWGRKIKDEHAAWKRDQIKRILYNRQYIGEWERTIDGKKQMFSCPMVVDMELFQKAQKSLTHRSINKKNLGLGKLNPFSGRIFDKESGIPLKLYPHQRLKIRVFRLSYPKPAEISYERGNIPFEEVYQAVYEILVNENQTARKIAGMIGSQIWEEEKVKKIQKVKASAQKVFQKMLSVEEKNLPLYNQMIAGEISEDEYEMQKEINVQEFMECDEKLEFYLEEIKKIEKRVKEERHFDIAAYAYQHINSEIEKTVKRYNENERELFRNSMMSWSHLAGFHGNKVVEDVVRFNASSFSPKSAYNTLFVPPDMDAIINDKLNQMQNHIRVLNGDKAIQNDNYSIQGTFERNLALENDYLHFFAPGDGIFDSIVNNAVSAYKGRCAAVAIRSEINWEGFAFNWYITPDELLLLQNSISLKQINQYRGFLSSKIISTYISMDGMCVETDQSVIREFQK